MCAVSYDSAAPLSTEAANPDAGWIARYAQPGNAQGAAADYHAVLLQKLRAMELALHTELDPKCGVFESRCYVDTGPLIERVYAQYAGIGWTAKNTCPQSIRKLAHGFFLATIVTSLEMVESDARAMLQPDRCGTCTRCIDACPTGALDQPYRMDASRCIAYLTIEKRGAIAEEFREGIGRNVFGCDICQDVCPWNGKARRDQAPTSPLFAQLARGSRQSFAGVAWVARPFGLQPVVSRLAGGAHKMAWPHAQCRHRHGQFGPAGAPAATGGVGRNAGRTGAGRSRAMGLAKNRISLNCVPAFATRQYAAKSAKLESMSTLSATEIVLAPRMNRIEISATMAITAEAAKLRAGGANLVDFGAGEPHFATPQHIKAAANPRH